MTPTRLGKKGYAQLGYLLVKKYPEVAKELMVYCRLTGDNDLDRIPVYFKRFCEFYQINPLDYIGKIGNSGKVRTRRVFIAAILNIYDENIFVRYEKSPVMVLNFSKKLGETLAISDTWICMLIPQILFEMKTYPDFAEEVYRAIGHLKSIQYGET